MGKALSDYNDLAKRKGLLMVRKAVEAAVTACRATEVVGGMVIAPNLGEAANDQASK